MPEGEACVCVECRSAMNAGATTCHVCSSPQGPLRHISKWTTVLGLLLGIMSVASIFAPRLIEELKPLPTSQISIAHSEFDLASQSILVPIINTGQAPSYFIGAAFINETERLGFMLNVAGSGVTPLGPGLSELRLRQEVRLNDFANFAKIESRLKAEGLGKSKNNEIIIFYRENDGNVSEIRTSISNGSLLSFINANAVICSAEKDEWRNKLDLGPMECSDLNRVAFDANFGSIQDFRKYVRKNFLEGG